MKFLVAPNQLHHLFIKEWKESYPEAEIFGTVAVINKRKDVNFSAVFTPDFKAPWSEKIEQLLFIGSRAMEECVFP